MNWIKVNAVPGQPGRCVRSFVGSSIWNPVGGWQDNHSHTWDNAVNGTLALRLGDRAFAESLAMFLASPNVWNAAYNGYFQAVSLDMAPPRADDNLDWYTKLGHGSAANLFLLQAGQMYHRPAFVNTALGRVTAYISWLDVETVPFFPEVTTAVQATQGHAVEGNLVPFADTPWFCQSCFSKSFEETVEFVVSLHWAAKLSGEARYDSLAVAVFDAAVTYFWDGSRQTFYAGAELKDVACNVCAYPPTNPPRRYNTCVAFDLFASVFLAAATDPERGFGPRLDQSFREITGQSSVAAWLAAKLPGGLDGLLVSGACLEGARFSTCGNAVAGTEPSGDLLACLWGIKPALAAEWRDSFIARQDTSGAWWAAYVPDTCAPIALDSGFGFSYDGRVAIGAKLALGLANWNWYDPPTAVEGGPLAFGRLSLAAEPNPMMPGGVIQYRLAVGGPVTLTVVDVAGRLIETLIDREYRPAGWHRIEYRPSGGTGVYFIKLAVGTEAATMKLVTFAR